MFRNEEADVTIISYVMQAVGDGKNVVRACFATIPTCSCFLCSGCGGTSLWTIARCICSAGMERYSTSTRRALNKCLQLIATHALTGCDTTSFPFNKGKVSELSVLEAGYFPGLFHVHGEEDAMQWDLLDVGLSYFCAPYSHKSGTPMVWARYNLYTKTKAMPRLRNLPPNCTYLLHVQWAHLQMMDGS